MFLLSLPFLPSCFPYSVFSSLCVLCDSVVSWSGLNHEYASSPGDRARPAADGAADLAAGTARELAGRARRQHLAGRHQRAGADAQLCAASVGRGLRAAVLLEL